MSKTMVSVKDFEEYALKTLPRGVRNFYVSGANEECTARDNIAAFQRWKIRPRVLRDVSVCNLKTTILGHEVDLPVGISPSCCHGLAHQEAEIGTATGAYSMKTLYIMASSSNTRMEDIHGSVPNGLHFFQLYVYNIPNGRELAVQMMHKAETLGFKAIVFTVDIPVLGKRYNEKRDNIYSMPKHLRYAEFVEYEEKHGKFDNVDFDTRFTWDDLKWFKSQTPLPFVVKGIMTAEDAVLAIESGMDGIFVSNHGGRQLDTVPATIDVLPEIVAAVAGRCEVYLDGGIRHGTDVFKALALGAKAVFIGRPAVYGLAYNGAEGVKQVLSILKDELSTAMALAGCSSLKDIRRDMVVHQSQYPAKL